MRKIFSIDNFINSEYHQFSLWYFVSFIYGIAIYYINSLKITWSYTLTPIIIGIFFSICLISYSRLFHKYSSRLFVTNFLCLLCVFAFFGIACAKYRDSTVSTELLKEAIYDKVEGDVKSLKPIKNGVQVVLNNVKIGEASKSSNVSLRLNLNSLQGNQVINLGDRIKTFAKILPLQSSILPGGFDFGFYMYLDGISASGYSNSEVSVLEQGSRRSFSDYIENLRNAIYVSLIENLGKEKGNFVAAILIGHTTGIDQKIADNMRDSGVSHILSVSGLHLSLVAMIFFFTSRVILNLSGYLANKFDIKKLAAIISITASFMYLLLTGSKVAATRAFIMTSIFISANMVGRFAYPMRSVFIAAFVILVYSPEFIMHPSFQLSFSAVICLISGYQFYLKNIHVFGSRKGLLNYIKLYILANIYSSIIASIATGPFVIFHFFKFANYSILMNLVAVPLTSFIIMPFGCLALILFGSGFEVYIFKFIGYFVQVIIDSADLVVDIPGSVWNFGYITEVSLGVYAFGFFFVCIFQTSIRYLGFLIIAISIMIALTTPRPKIIYDSHYGAIGLFEKDEVLRIFSEKRVPEFTSRYWMNWGGAKSVEQEKINLRKQDALFVLDNYKNRVINDQAEHDVLNVSINYSYCREADVMIIASPQLNCSYYKNHTDFNSSKNLNSEQLNIRVKNNYDAIKNRIYIDYEKYSKLKTLIVFGDTALSIKTKERN